MTQRHQTLSQASWGRGVAALTLLSLALLSSTASAQVEETAPASTCGKFSYDLVASGNRRSTPVQISLNGKSMNLTDKHASAKQTVTLQEKNRLQTTWKILKTYPVGTKVKPYSSQVTLRLINGNRVTNMFYLDTAKYPGKRELTYNFSAPPKGNVACVKENYTLQFRGASDKVVEWTVAVDGNYYLYRLSVTSYKSSVDLRPFLRACQDDIPKFGLSLWRSRMDSASQ